MPHGALLIVVRKDESSRALSSVYPRARYTADPPVPASSNASAYVAYITRSSVRLWRQGGEGSLARYAVSPLRRTPSNIEGCTEPAGADRPLERNHPDHVHVPCPRDNHGDLCAAAVFVHRGPLERFVATSCSRSSRTRGWTWGNVGARSRMIPRDRHRKRRRTGYLSARTSARA